jgi:hypothetical protein
MFVVLIWVDHQPETIAFLYDENGEPMIFESSDEALLFASENCVWKSKVVEVG